MLYDNWNLIAKWHKTSTQAKTPFVKKTYLWGLDISGSLRSGVGGLYVIADHSTAKSTTYAAVYDGNGNLVALGNAVDGWQRARYQYDPIGQVLEADGPAAALNSFGFSTKYKDAETGLLYYGHRHYSPNPARWFSRDPIKEQGGLNFCGFIGNDPINKIDIFGLQEIDV